ncbi:hypothetical protein PVAND_001710 [Polypedilum vanderplanki]|uniref:Uncharacterized protein n=1 Tax=Polypedilum vanderplanki TaxID=319348 RepID=A0A9J6BNS5_POLVA|nr:hypothetical protein PVAND_001710 [Polypedilum vanderplanki]
MLKKILISSILLFSIVAFVNCAEDEDSATDAAAALPGADLAVPSEEAVVGVQAAVDNTIIPLANISAANSTESEGSERKLDKDWIDKLVEIVKENCKKIIDFITGEGESSEDSVSSQNSTVVAANNSTTEQGESTDESVVGGEKKQPNKKSHKKNKKHNNPLSIASMPEVLVE